MTFSESWLNLGKEYCICVFHERRGQGCYLKSHRKVRLRVGTRLPSSTPALVLPTGSLGVTGHISSVNTEGGQGAVKTGEGTVSIGNLLRDPCFEIQSARRSDINNMYFTKSTSPPMMNYSLTG